MDNIKLPEGYEFEERMGWTIVVSDNGHKAYIADKESGLTIAVPSKITQEEVDEIIKVYEKKNN